MTHLKRTSGPRRNRAVRVDFEQLISPQLGYYRPVNTKQRRGGNMPSTRFAVTGESSAEAIQ